jgi:hypothetical protein
MGKLILENLEIKNFKAFEHLCIEKLGRVNLIAGMNNVGKTCLLESLSLYASGGAPSVIRDILISRDDAIVERPGIASAVVIGRNGRPTDEQNALLNLTRLVHRRRPIDPNGDISASEQGHLSPPLGVNVGIIDANLDKTSIGPLGSNKDALSLSIGWFRVLVDEEGSEHVRLIPVSAQDEADFDNVAPYLIRGYGKKSMRTLLSRIFRPDYAESPQYVPLHRCIFVHANGLSPGEVNELWDETQLTALEDVVLSALRIIAPQIERISMKGLQDPTRDPIPIVKMSDVQEPLPLRSLGDGMSRMFGIALALVNARDGFLLIDETENGLYHAIMPDVWRLILKVAKDLNVQVFATTHSWDCIEGFQEAMVETELDEGMMLRLDRKKAGNVAILYDHRRLTIATKHHVEVR